MYVQGGHKNEQFEEMPRPVVQRIFYTGKTVCSGGTGISCKGNRVVQSEMIWLELVVQRRQGK